MKTLNFKKQKIKKSHKSFVIFLVLPFYFLLNIDAQAQYVNIPVTGFTNDIVADGTQSGTTVSTGSFTSVTQPAIGVDGVGYTFIDATYKWYSGSTFPTCFLPTGGVVPSALTAGLTYQLQNYTGLNAMTIASNTYSGSVWPTSGSVSLVTPASYGNLYVLYETVQNTAGPTIGATITFTDATTQVISGNTFVNWFTATGVAYSGIGRAQNVAPGNPSNPSPCGSSGPYLFQMTLPVNPANYGKLVQSISFNFSAATGAAANTVNYFHLLAVGGIAPCVTPVDQPSVLNLSSPSGTIINGTFTAAPSTPSGYLTVAYPSGATPVAPTSGTTYTIGNSIGTGKVVGVGALTSFGATGLYPGVMYDFYVYSFNSGACAITYNTTSPLTGSFTTSGVGATLLISPYGDGGFETGTTLALNNWNVVNSATNAWTVGTVPTGFTNRSAYISNNAGPAWAYTNTSVTASHIYKDITFPAGQSDITLTFNWKALGEASSWDAIIVYTCPTSITPVAGQPASTTGNAATWTGGSPTPQGAQLWNQGTNTQTFSICLPAAFAGTTQRIVITWKNDGTAGVSPPAAVDNIALVSSVPVTPVDQATTLVLTPVSTSQINGSFTAATSVPAGYVVVRYPAGAAITNPVNGTVYTVGTPLGLGIVISVGASTTFSSTGLSGGTTYDYYVYDYLVSACSGNAYNNVLPLTATQTTNACGTLSGTLPIGPGLPNDTIGGWTSLTNAIAYITANGLGGNLLLELQTGYDGTSANETFPITFPFNPCINNTKTLTIRPALGVTGLSITNTTVAQTLNFNGASYVTIDGRPGGTGGTIAVPNAIYLTVKSTVAATATSTIQMINDANNITIKYCDLQGQSITSGALPGIAGGVVFIGNTTGFSGNDNNTIDNCNIHSALNTNPLTMGVYSFGPAASGTILATFNDNNSITNNNIYDIYGGVNLTTAGIELEKGTNAWTITGNSIFQTINRTPVLTASVVNRGIYIIPTNTAGVGNGFTISGNYIGGMAPQCGGNNYSSVATGSFNNQFEGMQISVAGGTTTNIKSNTINNFNIGQAASTGDVFHAIWIANNGNVNIGGPASGDGNIVGTSTAVAGTTTGITLNSASAAPSHMIIIPGGSTAATTVLVQNNKVGGITINGNGCPFSGLFCNSTATVTFDNNLVGSTTIPNSINATNAGTTSLVMRGINIPSGSCTATITNNTIANLTNASTSVTSGSQTGGIIIGVATAIVPAITGNTIFNLSCASAGTGGSQNATVEGIGSIATTAVACNISNNTIYTLVSTSASASAAIIMEGIFYMGSASVTNTVSANNVHSFNLTAVNPTLSMRGIECNGGTMNVFNNMVRLGINAAGADITTPISIYAMLKSSTAIQNFYHNSVYIGGSGVTAGTQPSYAYWRLNASTGSEDLKNNIFVNARSGAGAGKHYAVFIAAGQTANLSINNNVYQATGTSGVFAFNGAADVTVYTPGWLTGDVNSWNLNPQFNNPTGTAATVDLHINPSISTPVESTGINIPLVTLDIDGQTRSGLTPVDIGADAGNFTSLPPCVAPNTPAGVITLTPISGSQINGSFNPSVPAAESYTVVRYFAGATPTLPVNGTIYNVGNLLGAGTVISVGTSTTFSATGLFGGTAYDFYVYPANLSCVGASPFYNTLFPFATASTTACAGISGTFPIGPSAPASPAGFPFLKNALAYITANGMSGSVLLELQSDYSSVTDTVVIGNIPCIGPLQPLTIRPATGANGLSITTAHSVASVDVNGGSFVTIDGRPGGTGSYVAGTSLLIKNTNATAPAIRLINDARYNTIQYCDLQSNNSGATASATGGIVLIGTTTGPNGNDNNTIDRCDIHNISGGNPIMGINGLGTTTTALQNNENNTISNCNIYDYFNATVGTGGIYIGSGNGGWTITDNHFYQTALRIPTGTATYRDIYINNATANTTGSGFVITNNYFGGNDNAGNGLYNMVGASAYLYNSMTIGVGIGTSTSIQNNTFRNLSISSISNSAAAMSCIQVAAGTVNIGTITGNMVGAANTDASINPAIIYTNTSTSNGGFIPIFAASPTTCTISNNIVAGIQIVGNATVAPAEFNGIAYNNGTITISNNTIGSLTTAKSIYCSTTSSTATAASRFVGILISITGASGGITITGNTIANMYTNFAANTAPATSGAKGIFFTGTYTNSTNITVSNNTIRDITTFAQTTSTGGASPLQGISLATAGAFGAYTISGNTIYNLNMAGASTSLAVQAAGIYVNCTPSGASSISKNFVHSIDIAANNPSAVVTGIDVAAGAFTYSTNMIRLGINGAGTSVAVPAVFRGISKSTTTNNNFYFNTVYIGGTGVAASSSTTFGFVRTGSPTSVNDNINNNIFVNNRSNSVGGGASHFAIGIISGTTFLTSNNNNFYANGTDGALGLVGATTYCPTLPLWQLYSTKDAASYNDDPLLNNPIGDAAAVNLHINSGLTATNLESQGIAVGGITTDIDNDVRPGPAGSVNGGATAPDIGADEFDGVPKLPPAAPANPTQAAGTPTCAGGSVLTATGSAPSGVTWFWQTSGTGTDQSNNALTPLTVFANGTYYIRAYNTVTSLWSLTSGSVTVSNFPAGPSIPPAPVALNNPACATGTTISVTAAPGGQTYYWQSSTNATSTAQNANVSLPVTVAGTYYVRAVDNTTGCWSNANSVDVSLLAPLTGSYIATQIVTCGGTGTINISANGSATVFSNTFSSPAIDPLQASLAGVNAAITTLNVPAMGLSNQGVLQFTQAVNSQSGGILINNLTGLSSNDFQIDFDMITTTSTSGSPADGFSYSYGDDVVALPTGTATVPGSGVTTLAPENGSGTKLKFSFDAINNTGGCTGGVPAAVSNGNVSGVYLMYNCTASHQGGAPNLCPGVLNFDPSVWWRATGSSGAITHITIKMSSAGTATLQMTGVAGVATGQSFGPTSYALPASYLTENKGTWKHAFCARTGGLNEGHYIDNLSIQYSNIYEYSIDNGANWSFNQNFTGLTPGSYTVLVRYAALPNCITNLGTTVITAPPSVFTTTSTANPVCANTAFTTSLTPTAIVGSTYQWETSPDGTTWTPIPSATGDTYTEVAGITTPKYYHCIITCGANTFTSSTLLITINSFLNCYCASTATTTANEDILNVTYGTLNNTSNCASTGGPGSVLNLYSNYSAIAAPNIQQVVTMPFSIEVGTCSGSAANKTAIFIDLNQDGLLTGPGENVFISASATVGPHFETGSITLPITALTGITRMRVITVETTGTISPCGTYAIGETEDYTINITPAPVCSGTPFAGTLPANLTICTGTTASLVSTGFTNNVSGITFQWLESDDNGVTDPWAAVTTGTNGFSAIYNTNYTTAALTASIYYRVLATCTNGGGRDTTNAEFVQVINPQVTSVTNATRCGNGSVTICATGSVATALSWYTTPSGGSPLSLPFNAIPVTGFNNDIVASGIGSNSISGITYPGIGVDGANYYFMDNTYKYVSTNPFPTCFMPTNNLAASTQTSGLTYQLQSYTANNALSIANQSTAYSSPLPSSGTLTLATPASYGTLKVLYESVANTPTTGFTVDAIVTFTDATTQSFPANNCVNWFTTTAPAFSGMGRGTPSGAYECSTTVPNLFELSLIINAGNYAKQVQSITFSIPTVLTGAFPYSVNYFHAMAVGGSAPLSGSCFTTPVLTATTPYYVQASAAGCSSPRTLVTATVTPAPAISVSSASTICQSDSIILSATSPNDPNYKYTWNPGGLTGGSVKAAPLATTTYTVTALDTTTGTNTGCIITSSVTVSVNQKPSVVSLTSSPAAICLGDSAQISLSANPFIPPSGNYTVASIPFAPVPGTMPNAGPAAGDETNANAALGFNFNYFGNTYTDVTIHSNGQILMGANNTSANSVYTPPTIPSAAAPNNWVGLWADLNLNGSDVTWGIVGVAPYRKLVVNFTNVNYYSATPFITFQTVLNETYNTIDVHVTSTNGTAGLSRTIGVENSTGTLGTTAPGRTPGLWAATNESWEFAPPVVSSLTYAWAPSTGLSSTNVSSPKAAPTVNTIYTVTISETGTGCTRTSTISINVAAMPSPYIFPNDTTLCTGNIINIVARDNGAFAGGWPVGTQFDFGFGPSTDSTFQVNGPGTFTVQVYLPVQMGSCNTISGIANINYRDAPVLFVNTVNSNINCSGLNTGYVSAQVFLGAPPYRFVYYDQSGSIVRNFVTSLTEDTLFNASPGEYCVVVTDTITSAYPPPSCKSDSVCATVIAEPCITLQSANTPCTYLVSNITSTVTGGTPPFIYIWSNGKTTFYNFNVAAGTYTVTVTDANDYTSSTSITVAPPGPLTVSGVQTNILCRGAATGSINLTVSGAVPSYTYLWNGGTTTQNRSSLTAGSYTVTVTDANGCTKKLTFAITQPATNLVLNSSKTNVRCFGLSSGVATVTPSGGSTPYSYSWNTLPVQTTASISALAAGTYTCTITDAIGCTKTLSIDITEPTDIVVFQTQTNVTFPGGSNGTATVAVTGGTPGYTYSWNTVPVKTTTSVNGLTAGTYKCTIMDTKNCSKKVTFIITEPVARIIDQGMDAWNVIAYPNPTSGMIMIGFDNDASENFRLSLTDYTRREIFRKEGVTVEGLNETMYDFTGFAKGVYALKIETETKSKIMRVVIE